jgi:hypothetical protein
MGQPLSRPEKAYSSACAHYINTVTQLPSYEYKQLDQSAAEIRLISLVPHDKLPLPVNPSDLMPTKDCETQTSAVYRTINKFVEPGHKHGLLRFHVKHVSLKERPRYSALSYTWGDASSKLAIIVDNCILLVTENLYSALSQIRFPNEWIWIDAICINQDNQQEKSWQVQQMRDIYRQAGHTAAWLGEGTEESDQLMTQIGAMEAMEVLHARSGSIQYGKLSFSPKALCNWIKRPYWRRVWIQQEQRSSRVVTLHCGNKVVSRNVLISIVRLLQSKSKHDLPNRNPLPDVEDHDYDLELAQYHLALCLERSYLPKRFMERLKSGIDLQATDRRDFVYAWLGIAADAEDLGIVVDYSKTWQQVFTELSVALIKQEGFQVIKYCHASNSTASYPELPSWVFDFSRDLHEPFCNLLSCGIEQIFRYNLGSGELKATFSFLNKNLPNPSNILIGGTRVDVVMDFVYDAFTERVDMVDQDASWLASLELSSMQGGNIYGSDFARREAVWRTCVADVLLEINGGKFDLKRAGADEGNWCHNLMAYARSSKNTSTQKEIKGKVDEGTMLQTFPNTGSTAANRKYFVSKKGYLGLGPLGSKVGDLVVILFGLDMPFVLRPVDGGQYRIIGETYLHGIMDGEFMSQNPPAETFTIC